MLAGALVGWLVGPGGTIAGLDVLGVFGFLGTLFINLLKMVVVPLVSASIINGVASAGSGRDLGRLGARTLAFYVFTTLLAVLMALTLVDLIRPGMVNGEPAHRLLALESSREIVAASVQQRASATVYDMLLSIVPTNIIEAAAGNKLLGVMFFSLLFGFFLARIELPYRQVVADFWQGVFRVMMRMTVWVMSLAPIGIFGLTARVVAKSGVSAAGPILAFGACVVIGLTVYAFVALPVLLRLTGFGRPWRLFTAMAPALLTAFSTASSAAALPLSLECLELRAGVSERIAGFVMPLGTSINHAGSALYECAGAMFIAQAYGLELSFAQQFTIVVLALLTSMGIASIPAASLVAISVILAAVGLPPEGIGALLVLDRLLDMARTSINVFADSVCTLIVARLEGETGLLAVTAPTRAQSSSPQY